MSQDNQILEALAGIREGLERIEGLLVLVVQEVSGDQPVAEAPADPDPTGLLAFRARVKEERCS